MLSKKIPPPPDALPPCAKWTRDGSQVVLELTAANLGRLTNSINIQPVENFVTLDYQTLLEIRVARFEPDQSGHLVIECTWKLQPVAGHVAASHSFHTRIPIVPADTTTDLSGRIAAMNEALGRPARDIARSL